MAICYRSRSFSNTSQSAGTARIRRLSLHSQSLPRPAICLPELCPLLQLCPLYCAFSASLPSWNWPSLLPAQKVASLTFRKQSSSQSQPQPQIRRGTFWVPLLSREPAFHLAVLPLSLCSCWPFYPGLRRPPVWTRPTSKTVASGTSPMLLLLLLMTWKLPEQWVSVLPLF